MIELRRQKSSVAVSSLSELLAFVGLAAPTGPITSFAPSALTGVWIFPEDAASGRILRENPYYILLLAASHHLLLSAQRIQQLDVLELLSALRREWASRLTS